MEVMIGFGLLGLILLSPIFIRVRLGRKLAAQSVRLRTSEQFYQSLFEHNPDLVISFDLDGNFLKVNRMVEFFGYSEEEILNRSFVPHVAPDELENTLEHFRKAKGGQSTTFESAICSKAGQRFEFSITNIPIVMDGQIIGVYAILKDITKLKKVQTELIDAEAKYRSLAEDSLVGIYIVQNKRIVYANQRVLKMMGYCSEEIIGINIMDLVYQEDQEWLNGFMDQWLKGDTSSGQYQFRALKSDQTIIHLEVHGSLTTFRGKPAMIGTVIDSTERKKAEEKIEYMAYHDALTGLSNRYDFYKKLHSALTEDTTDSLAVLFFDLDRFKVINDSMGHGIGDRLLQAVTERVKECIPNQSNLARNGGDEFIVSLKNFNKQEVEQVAEKIIDGFSTPFTIGQYEIFSTPSIGISRYPEDGDEVETLIKKADAAMYQAKRNGKNNYEFYFLDQFEHMYDRFEMENDLRKALEREEFELYYQPKIDLTTGKINGVEALIRWMHPEKGLISPDHFIPLAEEIGLIIPIGEWVLRTACLQNKEWQRKGIPPMVMSVNLSVRQMYQPNLVEMVQTIMKETRLAPEYLEIEITESMLMDIPQGLKVLHDLKNLGLQISLDDFGTGYSSLHYLKEFPIDKLKIDQSFVKGCTVDSKDATIVKTVIAMAHELRLQVVAEGVESKESLIFLQRHLCNEAQGYLFSKPILPNDLIQQIGNIEKIVAMNGISQRESNQKRMEEALQIARQELVDTLRQQQGMIFKFVKEYDKYIHTLCDGELLYRMGLIPEQVIGNELSNFLEEKDAKEKIQYYQRAWAGEENVTYEGNLNEIEYITSLRPVKRGGIVVEVIGSCIDITDRKRIEKALRQSESNYRLIAENMQDLVGVWDAEGRVKYASPSHEKILGYPVSLFEEASGINLIHPDDVLHVQQQFNQMVKSTSPIQMEFRCKHRGGKWVYIEAHGTPVVGDEEKVEHFVFVGRDITERKKMEDLIKRAEKLSAVSQLAAGVAHEIRNPLTSIKGFLQILKHEVTNFQYVDIMMSEITHLEKVAQEFLALAKPQSGKKEPNDLNTLLQHVVTLIGTPATQKNVELLYESESNLPKVMCDKNQIKQVFLNILHNALEATSEKGIIKIQVTRSGPHFIKYRFIDHGTGISKERLRNIGEPFYSNKEKGTGLGLMISHKIVEEHGGTITIESIVHEGTTVEVNLPISLEKTPRQEDTFGKYFETTP